MVMCSPRPKNDFDKELVGWHFSFYFFFSCHCLAVLLKLRCGLYLRLSNISNHILTVVCIIYVCGVDSCLKGEGLGSKGLVAQATEAPWSSFTVVLLCPQCAK